LPGFDGTGPLGQGPLTGRGMGFCVVKLPDEEHLPFGQGPVGRDAQQTRIARDIRKEVSEMPAGDGTGPLGFGPMTGRAAGYCAGYPVPGYMNPMAGAGAWGQGAYSGAVPGYGFAGQGAYPAYGYGAAYGPAWGRPFGRGFGGAFGRGRGLGRGFGRGFGRGRGRW